MDLAVLHLRVLLREADEPEPPPLEQDRVEEREREAQQLAHARRGIDHRLPRALHRASQVR